MRNKYTSEDNSREAYALGYIKGYNNELDDNGVGCMISNDYLYDALGLNSVSIPPFRESYIAGFDDAVAHKSGSKYAQQVNIIGRSEWAHTLSTFTDDKTSNRVIVHKESRARRVLSSLIDGL